MSKPLFSVLSIDELVEHVTGRIKEGASTTGPAFALILGAGFSYPLFPTASGMVKQDMAWWKFARKQGLTFADLPPEHAGDDLRTYTQAMWSAVQRDTRGEVHFTLDESTGLPADGGDNITQAYQAIMSGRASRGLNTPGLRRSYFRDLCRRVDKRINLAHLYLGSLLHGQAQETWKKGLSRSTFTQTILTTNFDPLLQRALQLHNVLYFMSDQPEGGITPPEDDEQAVHLVYTHGSVHRRHLANNPSEILSLSQANATALSGYLARQGVIVIGYSGWNDTTFQALRSCVNFEGNLYWCGRESGEVAAASGLREDVKAFLSKNLDNRFYVELGPGGADDLLYRIHRALIGALPTALIDPAGLMINEIASVTWPENEILSQFDDLKALAQNQLTLLREFREKISTRVDASNSPASATETATMDDELSAASLNVRATVAFHNGEFDEAIRYLSMIIDMQDAPVEQRARALFNRGLARGQMKPPDIKGKIVDYSAVISMQDAPTDLVASALYNRGLAKSQMNPPDLVGAIRDYNSVVAMPNSPAEQRARALVNRGIAKSQMSPPDIEGAFTDFNSAVAMPDGPVEQRAKAIFSRGVVKANTAPSDISGVIAEYSSVIDMPDAPAEQRAKALYNRGTTKVHMMPPDLEGAINDYSALLAMANPPPEQQAAALVNRGIAKTRLSVPDIEGAIADYNAALATPGISDEQRAIAIFNRGNARDRLTPPDLNGAINDYNEVLSIPETPTEQRALGLFKRGHTKGRLNPPDLNGAISDYSAVLMLPNAPIDRQAWALFNRGNSKHQMIPPNLEGAIADYNAVLAMPDAPAEVRAKALLNRGFIRGQMTPPDIDGEINDYSAVVAMVDAPPEQRSKALANRATTKYLMSPPDVEGAITDYNAVMEIRDAAPGPLAFSAYNLACFSATQKNTNETIHWLREWRKWHANPTRQQLDNDSDFDAIRNDPEFVEFRESLPINAHLA